MSKRRWDCRRCGKPRTKDRPISKRGYCPDCGVELMVEAQEQLRTGQGPVAEAHLAGLARAVERARQQP